MFEKGFPKTVVPVLLTLLALGALVMFVGWVCVVLFPQKGVM